MPVHSAFNENALDDAEVNRIADEQAKADADIAAALALNRRITIHNMAKEYENAEPQRKADIEMYILGYSITVVPEPEDRGPGGSAG